MELESKIRLKSILGFFFLVILWLSYILRISNPFVLSEIEFSISAFILASISMIIPLVNLLLLVSFSSRESVETRIFFFLSFLVVFTMIISPGLSTGGLFNNDSFYHLNIIRTIISYNDFDQILNYGEYGEYGGFFFHKIMAIVAIITDLNPHFLLLFLPQLIMFSLFFSGMYLVIFRYLDESYSNKQFIFLISIFLPRHIFQNASFHPYYFLISMIPLAIYLSLNLTKKSVALLVIINMVAILSHIYGLVFLVYCTGIALLGVFAQKTTEIRYAFLLLGIWLTYGIGILIILMPNLIEILIPIFPLPDDLKKRILVQFQTGGALLSAEGAAPSVQAVFGLFGKNPLVIIKTGFEWTLFYAPIFLALVCNQLSYIYYQKRGKMFKNSSFDLIKLFSDLVFVFFILSLFYGADLLMERTVVLVFPIYLLVSIHYLLMIGVASINRLRNINVGKSSLFQFFFKNREAMFRTIVLFVILAFSMVAFANYRDTTIMKRYEVANWINENIPENSTFLASLSRMSNVIRGLTLRHATSHCDYLFDNSMDEFTRVYQYLSLPEFYNNSVYLILDLIDDRRLDKLWVGYPSVGRIVDPLFINMDKALGVIMNSNHYSLIYNNTEILIYQLVLYP